MVDDKRIYHIVAAASTINPKQLSVGSVANADLGFIMWQGKDAAGGITEWLAKDKPAWVTSLKSAEEIWLGSSKEISLLFDTAQTPDSLVLGLDSASNALIVCQEADTGSDFAVGIHTDPTLVMKAAGVVTAARTELSHGLINAKSGDLQLNANNLIFDCAPNSHTFVGTPAFNIILGESLTVNSQYTQYSLIVGDSHTVNAGRALVAGFGNNVVSGTGSIIVGTSHVSIECSDSAVFGGAHTVGSSADFSLVCGDTQSLTGSGFSYVGGEDCTVVGNHSLVHGDSLSVSGDHCAVFGAGSTIANLCDYGVAAGTNHDVTSSQFYAIFGSNHTVNSSNSLIFGATNEAAHDHVLLHGSFAKSRWSDGHFFASVRLDGSTTGISQCFGDTMIARHTESTAQVVLTSQGTGTVSPLVIPQGMIYTFELIVLGAYEGASPGGQTMVCGKVAFWHNASGIYGGWVGPTDEDPHIWDSGTTPLTSIAIAGNDTDGTIEIKVTPASADAANWVAHLSNGVMIETGYTATS